jgi:hypothetical protein
MNTANLQLEGLYLCLASISNALVAKGVLSRREVDAALASAEATAVADYRNDQLSDPSREAVVFPIRLLRLMINSASETEIPRFSEMAKLVGQIKDTQPIRGAREQDVEAATIQRKLQDTAAKASPSFED